MKIVIPGRAAGLLLLLLLLLPLLLLLLLRLLLLLLFFAWLQGQNLCLPGGHRPPSARVRSR